MSFEKLNLIEPILKALKTEGYTTPTPIQAQAIPLLLNRKDLLGCAQTGTGKTAAFAIPIIQLLTEDKNVNQDFLNPIKLREKVIISNLIQPTLNLEKKYLLNPIG